MQQAQQRFRRSATDSPPQDRVQVVVGVQRDAWNDFVAAAGGSVLQSWQWGEFKRSQGWRLVRLLALHDGTPCAAIQIQVRVVPGLGMVCYAAEGPVLPPEVWAGDGAVLHALLAAARRRLSRQGALALRVDPLTAEAAAPGQLAALGLQRCTRDVQPSATAVVDLAPSAEALWSGLARDARYRINRAQRDGVTLRAGGAADITALATMIAETGRRKGFGVRDATYLAQLAAMLQEHETGAFIVAEMDGAMVGATLVATFGRRAASLYTASNEGGRRIGAQHLLHWTAMLRAKSCGCDQYDFRGVRALSDTTDHWAGMSFFKERFGTRHEELAGAWDHVYRPLAYRAFEGAQVLRGNAHRLLSSRLAAVRTRINASDPATEQREAAASGRRSEAGQ